MLFERTEEQEMLTDTLNRFVVDAVKPRATAWSQAGQMPQDALGILAHIQRWRAAKREEQRRNRRWGHTTSIAVGDVGLRSTADIIRTAEDRAGIQTS